METILHFITWIQSIIIEHKDQSIQHVDISIIDCKHFWYYFHITYIHTIRYIPSKKRIKSIILKKNRNKDKRTVPRQTGIMRARVRPLIGPLRSLFVPFLIHLKIPSAPRFIPGPLAPHFLAPGNTPLRELPVAIIYLPHGVRDMPETGGPLPSVGGFFFRAILFSRIVFELRKPNFEMKNSLKCYANTRESSRLPVARIRGWNIIFWIEDMDIGVPGVFVLFSKNLFERSSSPRTDYITSITWRDLSDTIIILRIFFNVMNYISLDHTFSTSFQIIINLNSISI